MASTANRRVVAGEDIVSTNGIKLIAGGAALDRDMQERLLLHKLAKPLEACVLVENGVYPGLFKPLADELLAQYPLLAALTAQSSGKPVPTSLASLSLSPQVQSLLTIYADHQGDRLRHSVGVAMIALGFARHLLPGEVDTHRSLALAGLLHDVGELYIAPDLMTRDRLVQGDQWRHIAAHPVVGHRLLMHLAGAGPMVADAVLLHHERMDGFGYPNGVRGPQLRIEGEILAAAEWLMGLVESDAMPLSRASISTKLMPGDFSPPVIRVLSQLKALGFVTPPGTSIPTAERLAELAVHVHRLVEIANRYQQAEGWIETALHGADLATRKALAAAAERMARIYKSFNSTGLLDPHPEQLLDSLAEARDLAVIDEISMVVRELSWRLRELERETLIKAEQLPDEGRRLILGVVSRLMQAPERAPTGAMPT